MFPSANFFRGLDCPDFDGGHECCKRPYCHFRHVRNETQAQETDLSTQIPGYNILSHKDASMLYKALPSVPKPSRPHSSQRHPQGRERRRKTHHQKRCQPQTQFSYVPTPISQLSRRKSDELAPPTEGGAGISPSPMEYNPLTPVQPATAEIQASEYDPTDSKSVGIPGGILNLTRLPEAPVPDISPKSTISDANGTAKLLPSDETNSGPADEIPVVLADHSATAAALGAIMNSDKDEDDDPDLVVDESPPDPPDQNSKENLSVTGHVLQTQGATTIVSAGINDDKAEKSDPPHATSAVCSDFVTLQKQQINRIESQLADLARQKALAEQSIADATMGRLAMQMPKETEASLTDLSKPAAGFSSKTFIPDPSVPVPLTYSHIAPALNAVPSLTSKPHDNLEDAQGAMESASQSAPTKIAVNNVHDIKVFIQHVRKKSKETQSDAPSSAYEPNPADLFDSSTTSSSPLSFNDESDPEGTFSSDEEDDVDQGFDLPGIVSEEEEEEEEDNYGGAWEGLLSSMDSGFSEASKATKSVQQRGITTEQKPGIGKGTSEVTVKQEKTDPVLFNEIRKASKKSNGAPVQVKVEKTVSAPEKGKKTTYSGDVIKIRKETVTDSKLGEKEVDANKRKKKLSAMELSSFFHKKNKPESISQIDRIGKSPRVATESASKTKSDNKNLAKSEAVKHSSGMVIKKENSKTNKVDKLMRNKESSRPTDVHQKSSSSKKINSKNKIPSKGKVKPKQSSSIHKDKSPRKDDNVTLKSKTELHLRITKKVDLGIRATTASEKKVLKNISKRDELAGFSEASAKRKFSQLFGDSSDESDDAVVVVPEEIPIEVAVSSDSDVETVDAGRISKVPKRDKNTQKKKATPRKDAYSLSSDSSSNKEMLKKTGQKKMLSKSKLVGPKLDPNVKQNVDSLKQQHRQKREKPFQGSVASGMNPATSKSTFPIKPSPGVLSCEPLDLDNGSDSDDEINFISNIFDQPSSDNQLPSPSKEGQKYKLNKVMESDHSSLSREGKKKKVEQTSKQRSPSKEQKYQSDSILRSDNSSKLSKTEEGGKMGQSLKQRSKEPASMREESKAVQSSSDEDDFVPVEDFAVNEDLFCDSDDLQDDDAYDECLQIFKENWNVIPAAEQKKKALEIQAKTKHKEDKEEPSQSSRRHAHVAKFDTKRVRKLNNKRTAPLPTPAQLCHKRFLDAQKAALDRQEQEEEVARRNKEDEDESQRKRDEEQLEQKRRDKHRRRQEEIQKMKEEQSQRQQQRLLKIREDQAWKRHMEQPQRFEKEAAESRRSSSSKEKPSQREREEEWQRLREEQAHKKEKSSFVKSATKQRVSHAAAQENGNKRKSSSGSKSSKKQKTLAMTADRNAKRTAHIQSKVTKRPILPTEYGSKIPSNVRTRYLNLFIDELLKTCKTEQSAFDKALAQEKEICDRASSKGIYLNLSVNAIKRFRSSGSAQPTSTSTSNPYAMSHQAILGGKAATLTTYTLHKHTAQAVQKFEGLFLFEKLKPYLATETDLENNGYPRPSEEKGKAIIKTLNEKKKSSDPNQQVCCRCGKTFLRRPNGKYITKEQCVHHWGKLWTKRVSGGLESRYSCCSGDVQAQGCGVAKLHVTDDKVVNYSGFMTTMVKSPPADGNAGVFALDCEMCYTSLGLELTRVTIINDKLERVYDSLVKPLNDVVDYNTKFSGITEEDLETVKTTLQNVQAVLLNMFSSETILIGHSLESDLLALKLIHSTVIDTALVFPHRRGPPYKRALRTLTAEFLQKLIQDDESGHDSMEDARSCMELMIYKIKQDLKLKHH